MLGSMPSAGPGSVPARDSAARPLGTIAFRPKRQPRGQRYGRPQKRDLAHPVGRLALSGGVR